MGWPRKDDLARIYRDKDKKTYFIVFVDALTPGYGWDAIANVLTGDRPSLGTAGIPPGYVARNFLKRVAWDDLPAEWRKAFRPWLTRAPGRYRGFWRIGHPNAARPPRAAGNK